MKKSTIILLSIAGVILLVIFWFIGTGNNLVQKEEAVKGSWSQVQNVYQRRMDLIPNLVSTVKGYAEHERSTLQSVVEARNQATKVDLSSALNDPQKFAQLKKAQDSLGGALSRLMVVVEKYPDLKANENFRDLQVQLEGTENRIAVERRRFNEVVQEFNSYIRYFPQSIVAGMKGMMAKTYFEADVGASKAPTVDFNKK